MRALPGHASRVPPGPRPLSRTESGVDQRRRILRATVELVAKRGYQDTSAKLIVRRAKVGYATFYKFFNDKEDVFLTVFDGAYEFTSQAVADAYAEGGDERPWPERVAAALRTLYRLIASDPPLARACLVESLTASPTVIARYEQALRQLGRILAPGRELAEPGVPLPATLEKTLAGGILWIAYQRLIVGEADRLEQLLPEALEFTLSPYLGEERALRVIGALDEKTLLKPA